MELPKGIAEMEAEGMRKWNEIYGNKDGKASEVATKPEEKIQHQFDVLKGKYDAEVPRLAIELAETNKRNAELQGQLDEAKKLKEEPKPPEGEEKIKILQEDYPDIYEGASSLMKQLITEAKGDFSKDISEIKKDVKEVRGETGRTQKQLFLDALDGDPEVGKEWRSINQDDGFISWLQNKAPYGGKKMHDLLMDDWNGMDVEATLEFFKDYKKIKKVTAVKDESEIITPDKLMKFADEVARGLWKGRDKEREAEEKRLTEGVVRWKQKSLLK
jgi:hypothetical protein